MKLRQMRCLTTTTIYSHMMLTCATIIMQVKTVIVYTSSFCLVTVPACACLHLECVMQGKKKL